MLGKLLPIILGVIGVGGGIGAGLALKPSPEETAKDMPHDEVMHEDESHAAKEMDEEHANPTTDDKTSEMEYVKLNNQFLVPVVTDQSVQSLVVMSLSVEVSAGDSEAVYSREPKLRDAFLQVLFDHANIGGFHGEFTNAKNLNVLRNALTEMAQTIVGDTVIGVLITDIARQDA